MHVVLVEPEIPPNTGNIARTCAATGTHLHLVGPLGFSLDDRYLKRAGLDYWPKVSIRYYENLAVFRAEHPEASLYLSTTKARRHYSEVRYQPGDFLVFGRETRGLPPELLAEFPSRCIRIPMIDDTRSLNLSNAVAIVLYEALRQLGFPGMT